MADFRVQDTEDVETDAAEQEPLTFENRIVKYDPAVDPYTLTPHPTNPKVHPQNQKDAIKGALGEIGWLDAVKVNIRTGTLIDGHERREQALAIGGTVPVLYVDLSPEEEALALATFDPIGALANYSQERLSTLLSDVRTGSEAVASLLSDLETDTAPTFQNKGQTGDRQIERATVVRIAIHVDDVRTVERAISATGVSDRGNALLAVCRYYLQTKDMEDDLVKLGDDFVDNGDDLENLPR